MHGSINTRDRYKTCVECDREAAFDTLMGWCVNTGCRYYFNRAPGAEGRVNALVE